MIDWFVLLIPLAVAPIVLVFGFVGCTLDSSGIPRAQLSYPAGLKQLLVEMEVTVEVTGANGESQSDTKTLQGEDLLPEGDLVDFFIVLDEIDAEEEGSAKCQCDLIVMGNPDFGVGLTADHDTATGTFVLTVTGTGLNPTDFHLA
jgi:hypothetical protein